MSGSRVAGAGMFLGGAALAVYTLAREPDDFAFRVAMSVVIAGIGAAFWFLGGRGEAGWPAPERVARHRDEPWLWRMDWAAGHAIPETRSLAVAWALAGVIDRGAER